ncbi:hypothetical protein A4X13_0g5422 [Tilletia indica]|uniref:Uncharacterized protein n=1 Tax=Tilletia indica TaxID=43049 RepID=A0A177TP81_9BASI|nr:hypothetical protein A4X13_0g5422 [Tilletia indica]
MHLNSKFTLLLCALLMTQPVLSASTWPRDDAAELIPQSGAIGPGTKNDLGFGDDLGFNTKGSGKSGSDAFDRRDGLNLGLEHGYDTGTGAYGVGKGFPGSNKKEKVLHHNDLFAKKIAAAKKKSGFDWFL